MPKVIVIGTTIGCTLHVRALRAAGFDIIALVGRDAEKTEQRARYFGIAQSLTSIDAAIDSDCDAIVVATPPATHHPIAMKAIAAGKHVLCEKPFTLDVGHARELRDAAKEAGVANMVNNEYRWHAQNAVTREMIREGALGVPLQITAVNDYGLCNRPELDVPDWWRFQDQGGGWVRNYNAHGIDLIRYMVGDFAAVCGSVHPGSDIGMTADDGYAVAFLLKNGVQGVMSGSCRSWENYSLVRILGTEGAASITRSSVDVSDAAGRRNVPISDRLAEQLRGGGPVITAPPQPLPEMEKTHYVQIHSSDSGYVEQVGLCSALASWIQNPKYRNPAIADFSDGLAHVQVIDAVERSRGEGRWIDIN